MSRSSDAVVSLDLDERVYPLEAVQNAAYSFTDRAHVRIESAGPGKLRLVMTPIPRGSASPRATLEGDFHNELLHQALRLKVSEANQKIREYIVTKALVSAQPEALVASAAPPAPAPSAPPIDAALEQEIDRLLAQIEGSGAADPLGVAVPWEEREAAEKAKSGDKTRAKNSAAEKKRAATALKAKRA